jgi:hypothetical protein
MFFQMVMQKEEICPLRPIQGAAEITPRFGRGLARGGMGVQQWGVRR